MSKQAQLSRMQRRMQSSAAPEEDLMPEEEELSGREERQERRAARQKRRSRNQKLRQKQKIERIEARSVRKGKRKKDSRRGGGSAAASSALTPVPTASPSPQPYAAQPPQPYQELPPAEDDYEDEGEEYEEEDAEDAEEEALEGMRLELGRAVRQGRLTRGDAGQMLKRLRGKVAANRDQRESTRSVRARQEEILQQELATARAHQADPVALRRYERFLRYDNRVLRTGTGKRMTWEAWYALTYRAPAPAMTPRQVQASRAGVPPVPAAPVAPAEARVNLWGPQAQLGPGIRIQAVTGLRAMTIELRPGLYLVAAVDSKVFQQPVNTLQGEIGLVPLLPGMMLKGGANAIRAMLQRGRDRRQARQVERQGGGHPLLPGGFQRQIPAAGFPTAPLSVSGGLDLGCACPWASGEDLE